MKPSPVVHFEMPAKDKARVSDFYASVFGWKMQVMGQEYGGYIIAQTTETDEQGMVKTPGNINGGFWESKKENDIPHVVISVDNLKQSMEDVKNNGGEILDGPMDIPGIGQFVMFKDTEGNHVGMLQPSTP
jgi:uncharacterized protein